MSAQRRYRSVRAVTEGTEADWQQWITEYAEAHGWLWAHIPSSKYGAGVAGFPDLVLVRGPEIIYAEVKMRWGRLSWDQHFWHQVLEKAGQRVYVWRPSMRPEIESVLN